MGDYNLKLMEDQIKSLESQIAIKTDELLDLTNEYKQLQYENNKKQRKSPIDDYCMFDQFGGVLESMPVKYQYKVIFKTFSEENELSENEKKRLLMNIAKKINELV